ncbi:MAG TPA: transglutaminase family protein [Cyanobacteria bacterium UBA8803]|nr:transglutaminase family protein [Cyanobacteria bacterium UBA9273]HBL57013.1 transglutaminase family protein [Cyanobacteria bacterium UBA8803]
MKFQLGCKLSYNLTQSSTFIFNISVVKNNEQEVIEENLKIEPSLKSDSYVSPFLGNRYIRITAPPENLQVSYQAIVELANLDENPDLIPEVPPAKLPLETLYYLLPTRYCQSDRLMRLAQHEFGQLLPDYSRVTAICNWIYDNVTYLSGSTNAHTSAYDTATERAGVCRDFAHLGIAFCRALNIPARFVSAYAYRLEPPDFHACFEAYLGDRWYLFDPTRLVPLDGIIRIGTGRDAADVSFATIFGPAQMQQMKIFVEALS